jgi:hypothetical protein
MHSSAFTPTNFAPARDSVVSKSARAVVNQADEGRRDTERRTGERNVQPLRERPHRAQAQHAPAAIVSVAASLSSAVLNPPTRIARRPQRWRARRRSAARWCRRGHVESDAGHPGAQADLQGRPSSQAWRKPALNESPAPVVSIP